MLEECSHDAPATFLVVFSQGGKSGASFAKSLDDRFVIKAISQTELNMFVGYASDYFGTFCTPPQVYFVFYSLLMFIRQVFCFL